jgi:hypothetical protein
LIRTKATWAKTTSTMIVTAAATTSATAATKITRTTYPLLLRTDLRNESVITYLLTPRSRVLLEKLTGFAASQEIPRIYETRNFITVLTSARQLSLS